MTCIHELDLRDCATCHAPAVVGRRGGGYSGVGLARRAGITYRQVDYWARTGLLRPSLGSARGSGTTRRYSDDDARVARQVKRVLELGISLQRLRGAMHYLRQPEGRWLYIGHDGTCGTTDDLQYAVGEGVVRVVIDLGEEVRAPG